MSTNELDGRWEGPNGQILVEIKRTASVRDVRAVLLNLAYVMKDEPRQNRAACVVMGTKLSFSRLRDELRQFREVMHPELAQRIHFIIDDGDETKGPRRFVSSLGEGEFGSHDVCVSFEFLSWLDSLIAREYRYSQSHQLPARQAVVAALVELRLANEPAVTVKYLQDICKVSYPTVSSALKKLENEGLLQDHGERGVGLRHLTSAEWIDLARDHAKARKSFSFVDPTGFTFPDQLANRLRGLMDAGKIKSATRIGGVLGAAQHFPQLDISAASRLDLSVDSDPTQMAAMLDAGLLPKTKSGQKPVLVIHATSVLQVGSEESQGPWANELECLADLVEMGYVREATEMAQNIEVANKQGNAR